MPLIISVSPGSANGARVFDFLIQDNTPRSLAGQEVVLERLNIQTGQFETVISSTTANPTVTYSPNIAPNAPVYSNPQTFRARVFGGGGPTATSANNADITFTSLPPPPPPPPTPTPTTEMLTPCQPGQNAGDWQKDAFDLGFVPNVSDGKNYGNSILPVQPPPIQNPVVLPMALRIEQSQSNPLFVRESLAQPQRQVFQGYDIPQGQSFSTEPIAVGLNSRMVAAIHGGVSGTARLEFSDGSLPYFVFRSVAVASTIGAVINEAVAAGFVRITFVGSSPIPSSPIIYVAIYP